MACGAPQDNARPIQIRAAIASLEKVPPETINTAARFDEELTYFELGGSLDTVEVVMELEKHLGTTITDELAQKIRNPELVRGLTVANFVRDAMRETTA